jgi:uncharacterized membrane protein YgcG
VPALGALSPIRHLVVGGAAAAIGVASYTGVIGEPRTEHFDSKQVTVAPAGTNGLRVREVVDIDFGDQRRHGYERTIPTDFGVPTEITAASDTAPDTLDVDLIGLDARIRIGEPDVTITGQHRYVLEYTYPDTTVATGLIALDVIGTDETFTTDRFEVVVTGFELANLKCNVGHTGAVGGCELVDDGSTYRAVIEPLEPGDGITIGATIVGTRPVATVAPPPLPEKNPDRRAALAATTSALGVLTGGGIYAWARRRGRNEVFSGGAADAAYGIARALPPPPPGSATSLPAPAAPTRTRRRSGVRLVADQRLRDLATIEFVPPAGVDPWLGNVLLGEKFTNDTVSAWFSGAAAREYLTITKDGDSDVELAPGLRLAGAPPADRQLIDEMFGLKSSITLGTFSKSFASTWSKIQRQQRQATNASGYWKRPLGTISGGVAGAGTIGIFVLVIGGLIAFRAPARALEFVDHPAVAVGLAVAIPAILALLAYEKLLPARTAEGSALTLRTESFRRFLAASEGQHVEWAWKHGLLREYSAWAVALGEASTWENAMERSSIPPAEFATGPMIVYTSGGSFSRTHTAPSSSGGSGGGGFSGGSVGGGGGGGSSGSW